MTIFEHNLSFTDQLPPKKWTGPYLQMDIPDIVKGMLNDKVNFSGVETSTILYTDVSALDDHSH